MKSLCVLNEVRGGEKKDVHWLGTFVTVHHNCMHSNPYKITQLSKAKDGK